MTTLAPVNPRATVEAVFNAEDKETPVPAGQFRFYKFYGEPEGGAPAGILFGCPCGCGQLQAVAIRPTRPERPKWSWDGNREKPTLSPSINILQTDEHGNRIGEHWHGWLQNGVFKSC